MHYQKFIYLFFATLSLFVSSLISESVFAFAPPHLKIVYKKSEDSSSPLSKDPKIKNLWRKGCKRLAGRLKVRKGPFGSGFFQSVSCHLDEVKLYGPAKPTDWVLRFLPSAQENFMQMSHKGKVLYKLSVPVSPKILSYFYDKGFADVLAFSLLRKLPALIYFDSQKVWKSRGFAVTKATVHTSARFSPPKKLKLYELSYLSELDVWVPHITGQAKLKFYKKGKYTKGKKIKSGKVRWLKNSRGNSYQRYLWAHAEAGRGRFPSEDEAKEILQSAFDQLEINQGRKKGSVISAVANFVSDTASSGYFGVRYGSQFLAKDDLLGKSAFLGVLLEIRDGPLEGVRFNYDFVPRVTSKVDTGTTFIKWDRLTTGMSFGFELPMLVDTISITPKIGVWDFDAVLPIITPTQTLRQDFKIKNRTSFGLEAALEWEKYWYLLRIWTGLDRAFSLNGGDASSVSTFRYGFDSFFTAGPSFRIFSTSLQSNFLMFAVIESISLDSTASKLAESDEFKISSISYDSGYVGGGMAISW